MFGHLKPDEPRCALLQYVLQISCRLNAGVYEMYVDAWPKDDFVRYSKMLVGLLKLSGEAALVSISAGLLAVRAVRGV